MVRSYVIFRKLMLGELSGDKFWTVSDLKSSQKTILDVVKMEESLSMPQKRE